MSDLHPIIAILLGTIFPTVTWSWIFYGIGLRRGYSRGRDDMADQILRDLP